MLQEATCRGRGQESPGMLYNVCMERKALFDSLASSYDSWFDTPVGRKVKALELNLLVKLVNPEPGLKMLEVGIGTGLFAMEFRKFDMEVLGIDPSEKMLEIAQSRGFNVKVGVGENIPYEDDTFDVVLAMTSMEASKEPSRFLSEMKRVAKPSGKVVVAVLNLLSFYGLSRRIRGLFKNSVFNELHFYTYWEFKKLLQRHLEEVHVSSSVFFNPSPLKFVLERAEAIEEFSRKYLKPFGALLAGSGRKKQI